MRNSVQTIDSKIRNRFGFLAQRAYWIDALHLFALVGMSLAQPLYDLLGRNAEFFAVRGSQPIDIWMLALLLSFVAPALLATLEAATGIIGNKPRRLLHAIWVTGSASVFILALVKSSLASYPFLALALSLCGGSLFCFYYFTREIIGKFLTVLAAASFLYPIWFLHVVPIEKLAAVKQGNAAVLTQPLAKTPIYFILFDELPVSSIMARDGSIDTARFPNFAALAETSHWFRNATTNGNTTVLSVPALLSSKWPEKGTLPLYRDHQENLFTLLSDSYPLNIYEATTELCPDYLCDNSRNIKPIRQRLRSLLGDLRFVYAHIVLPKPLTADLPPVDQGWSAFGRGTNNADDRAIAPAHQRVITALEMAAKKSSASAIDRFMQSLKAEHPARLNYLHLMIPHSPWEFLPSGKTHGRERIWPPYRFEGGIERILPFYQQHLLQTGYADQILGRIMEHIEAAGWFDQALIVVTSDHGTSFLPNADRRKIEEDNVADVIGVPLFIKAPYQSEGTQSDINAELIDVLPTLADVIGKEIPWETAGSSLLSEDRSERAEKAFYVLEKSKMMKYPTTIAPLLARVEWKHSILLSDHEMGLYQVGRYSGMVGDPIDLRQANPNSRARYTIDQEHLLQDVDIGASFVPAGISGTIFKESQDERIALAFSSQGLIIATATAFRKGGSGEFDFSVVLPESSLRSGANRLDVFLIETDAKGHHHLHKIEP